jgi:hypothetical protein
MNQSINQSGGIPFASFSDQPYSQAYIITIEIDVLGNQFPMLQTFNINLVADPAIIEIHLPWVKKYSSPSDLEIHET